MEIIPAGPSLIEMLAVMSPVGVVLSPLLGPLLPFALLLRMVY